MEGNPDFTVEDISERIAGSFPGDLGIEPLEVADERSRGRIEVERRHLHPGGFVHGGCWTALADTVAAWITVRRIPPGWDFTTVELKLNVFAAASEGDELVATASPLHVGRSTAVIEVRIHNGERLSANMTLTQFLLPPRA